MTDVFISYKSEEAEEARWVKSVLESNGILCWMAPECLPGGSNYAKEIPKAIKQAKVFLLILSSKAQLSQWVSKEISTALNERKIILPFMLDNCELTDEFNFYLTDVQRYFAYENKAAAIEKTIKRIKAILASSELEQTEKDKNIVDEIVNQDENIIKNNQEPSDKGQTDTDDLPDNVKICPICHSTSISKLSDEDSARKLALKAGLLGGPAAPLRCSSFWNNNSPNGL